MKASELACPKCRERALIHGPSVHYYYCRNCTRVWTIKEGDISYFESEGELSAEVVAAIEKWMKSE